MDGIGDVGVKLKSEAWSGLVFLVTFHSFTQSVVHLFEGWKMLEGHGKDSFIHWKEFCYVYLYKNIPRTHTHPQRIE